MDIVPFEGWSRCLRIVSGDHEIVVTTEVGPRVLFLGRSGGPNMLAVYARHRGQVGGTAYKSYGGHRLWTAPEIASRTYEPDNEPVELQETEHGIALTTPLGPTRLQRQICIDVEPDSGAFILDHRVKNFGKSTVEVAPWCLSVMAPGGTCLFPQAEFVPHTESLLPVRPIVMWSYTKMSDERWTWGDRVIRLRQTTAQTPQKIGACVDQGYAAYALHGDVFFKRFPYDSEASYPDFGVNFEAYTREDMLEIESLGPLTRLEPGDSISHRETWYLVHDAHVPDDDDACAEWLAQLGSRLPML